MSCRIIVALTRTDDQLVFRTADGRWSPLRHDAAALPAEAATRMAQAVEAQDATISVAHSLDADCVANHWAGARQTDGVWAARTADAPAFAPAAAWA